MLCFSPSSSQNKGRSGPALTSFRMRFMPLEQGDGGLRLQVACDYLVSETNTRIVVDPFCGRARLAVAKLAGASGDRRRREREALRAARALVLDPSNPSAQKPY